MLTKNGFGKLILPPWPLDSFFCGGQNVTEPMDIHSRFQPVVVNWVDRFLSRRKHFRFQNVALLHN
jgi:hypothetical protein